MLKQFSRPRLAAIAAVGLAALGGLGVLYAMAPSNDKTAIACSADSAALAARLAPLANGEVAALNIGMPPHMAVPVSFNDAGGRKLALKDFRGRAILLNLWATWCVPCRAEMPALDRLQSALGGDKFEVVAVNVDTARLDRPNAFLDQIGVAKLTRYADPSGDAFEALRLAGKTLGLPTSLLIDAQGCELGVLAGPAKWDSPDAQALVKGLSGG